MKILKSWAFRAIALLLSVILLLFAVFLIIVTMKDFKPKEKTALTIDGTGGRIQPSDSLFTIATWNIGYFGLGEDMDFFYDGGKKVRPTLLQYENYQEGGVGFLASMDTVDFILLQEVDLRSKRSYNHDQYAAIADKLPAYTSAIAINYNVWFVPVPVCSPMGHVLGGVAEYSRFRPEECYRGSLPGKYSWPTGLFMLDRCLIFTRYALPSGRDLVIINTHNEAFDAGEMRNAQMQYLRALMVNEYDSGNYVIAGGDWNMNPVGFELKDYQTGDVAMKIDPPIQADFFPEGWKWAFNRDMPTNRSVIESYERGKTKTTIIDFFVTSPNIEVEEVSTIDLRFRWSDHQPVIMKFRCAAH